MNKVSHPSGDSRFQPDELTRFGRAQYFGGANRSELESLEGRDLRIRLSYGPGELSGGFQKNNAGQKWLPWKMASQEWFVAADHEFAYTAFSWLEAEQSINKTELGSVGQSCQRGGQAGALIIVFV